METRRYEQSMCLSEDEDEDEKEKISLTITAAEGRWRQLLPESQTGRAADTGHCNGPPPRKRPPTANAQADVVQAAEERFTTVDNAAAWSDVALANDAKAKAP